MALDDYYANPTQECLARLFDAINSMDLSAAPSLTRHEKLVMRGSDRKDIFSEKFAHLQSSSASKSSESPHNSVETLAVPVPVPQTAKLASEGSSASLASHRPQHRATNSWDSRASVDEGIVMRSKEVPQTRERPGTESTVQSSVGQSIKQGQTSPSDSTFNVDGNTGWNGAEGQETAGTAPGVPSGLARSKTLSRGRSSTDASSSSGHGTKRDDYFAGGGAVPTVGKSSRLAQDTLSYQTSITYGNFQLPIKMPLSTFSEEVGDVRVTSV